MAARVAKDDGPFMRIPGVKMCCTSSEFPSAAVVAVSQMDPCKPPPQMPQASFDAFTGIYVDSATGEQATLTQDADVVTLACARWGVVVGRVSGDTISVTLSVAPSDGQAHKASSLTLHGHLTDGQIRWSDGTVWVLEVVKEGTMLLLPSVEDDRNNPYEPEGLDPLPEDADSSLNSLKGRFDDANTKALAGSEGLSAVEHDGNEPSDLAPRVPPTRFAGAAEPTPQSERKDSNGLNPPADEPRVDDQRGAAHSEAAASPKKVPPEPPFANCETPM